MLRLPIEFMLKMRFRLQVDYFHNFKIFIARSKLGIKYMQIFIFYFFKYFPIVLYHILTTLICFLVSNLYLYFYIERYIVSNNDLQTNYVEIIFYFIKLLRYP